VKPRVLEGLHHGRACRFALQSECLIESVGNYLKLYVRDVDQFASAHNSSHNCVAYNTVMYAQCFGSVWENSYLR
jgi:hypothetical protein